MKKHTILRFLVLLFSLAIGSLVLVSCNSDKMSDIAGPGQQSMAAPVVLAKKGNNLEYPQFAERSIKFIKSQGYYQSGNVNVPGGTTFHLETASLTPPPGTPQGNSVNISMLVEIDTLQNQLIFTFGESGCSFNPPAEVWFNWSDLGVDSATLYYIDQNGNYIPQTPDDVDSQGHRFKLLISHFSRYAIAQD